MVLLSHLTLVSYASNWTRYTGPALGTLCFRVDRAALQQLSNGYRLSFTLDELHPLWQLRLPLLTGIQTGVGQARERSREGEGGRG